MCNYGIIGYKWPGGSAGVSGQRPVTLSTISLFEEMSTISRPSHNGLLQADTANLMNMAAVFLEGLHSTTDG